MPPSDSVIWNWRAVEPQQPLALAAHALREREDQVVALGGAHERERDAGVAARRLDDRGAAGLDPPSASAASIIATPMRSLTEPPGLNISSLANSSPGASGAAGSAAPSACGRPSPQC
jgi:hypothetical protein